MLNFPKNRTLNSLIKSGQPNMRETLSGWEVPLTLIKITQNVIDGDLTTTETTYNFMGVWQPFSMQQLALLPEGQRSWSHYWLHLKSGILDLKTADKFIFEGHRYKVIELKDYHLNGFIEYHVVLDYEEAQIISNGDN